MGQYVNENHDSITLTLERTDKDTFKAILKVIKGIRQRVSPVIENADTITIYLKDGENSIDVKGQIERAIVSITRATNRVCPIIGW